MRLSVLVLLLFLMGCEGFKFVGSMCESIEPGKPMSECKVYDDEAAAEASLPPEDDSAECLKCDRPEKIEIRR